MSKRQPNFPHKTNPLFSLIKSVQDEANISPRTSRDIPETNTRQIDIQISDDEQDDVPSSGHPNDTSKAQTEQSNPTTSIKLQRHFIDWEPDPNAPNFEQELLDFYDPDADDDDAAFVDAMYRQGDRLTDAILCCPGCFTPLCYQCKRIDADRFESEIVINCLVESYTHKRRSDHKNVEKEAKLDCLCAECEHIVGFFCTTSNKYIFEFVLPSEA